MKKNYQKPAMLAVKIQQQHIICNSPGETSQGAKSLGDTEYFEMKGGGFGDNDVDM